MAVPISAISAESAAAEARVAELPLEGESVTAVGFVAAVAVAAAVALTAAVRESAVVSWSLPSLARFHIRNWAILVYAIFFAPDEISGSFCAASGMVSCTRLYRTKHNGERQNQNQGER